jgi:polar amino acid transport system substrate-binding protein
MKKLLCFLSLIVFLKASYSQMKKELTISITESCPKMCEGKGKRGFVTDILDEVLTMKGYKVNFVAMPWARAVISATEGSIDGIISPAKKEAPDLIYPKVEIAKQAECFYGRIDDNWKPTDAKSFINRQTIVFRGWSFEEEFKKTLGREKYKKNFNEFSIDQRYIDRILKMVLSKKIDSFWVEPIVFDSFKKKNRKKVENKIKLQGCLLIQDLYVGLNPLNPKLSKKIANDFDDGIEKIRKSGRLKTILQQYDIEDWKK